MPSHPAELSTGAATIRQRPNSHVLPFDIILKSGPDRDSRSSPNDAHPKVDRGQMVPFIMQGHVTSMTSELSADPAGLFRSVRPMLQRPNNDAHPQFLTDLDGSLSLIAPVGGVEFTLIERTLPRIISFEVTF